MSNDHRVSVQTEPLALRHPSGWFVLRYVVDHAPDFGQSLLLRGEPAVIALSGALRIRRPSCSSS